MGPRRAGELRWRADGCAERRSPRPIPRPILYTLYFIKFRGPYRRPYLPRPGLPRPGLPRPSLPRPPTPLRASFTPHAAGTEARPFPSPLAWASSWSCSSSSTTRCIAQQLLIAKVPCGPKAHGRRDECGHQCITARPYQSRARGIDYLPSPPLAPSSKPIADRNDVCSRGCLRGVPNGGNCVLLLY